MRVWIVGAVKVRVRRAVVAGALLALAFAKAFGNMFSRRAVTVAVDFDLGGGGNVRILRAFGAIGSDDKLRTSTLGQIARKGIGAVLTELIQKNNIINFVRIVVLFM